MHVVYQPPVEVKRYHYSFPNRSDVNAEFVRFRDYCESVGPQEFGRILKSKGHLDDRVNVTHRGLMVVPDEGTRMLEKFQIRQQMIFCATHRLVEYLKAQEPNEEGDFARVDYCGTNYTSDSPLDRLVSFFQTKAQKEKGVVEFWYARVHEMDRKGESKAVMDITTPILGKIEPLLFATTEMLAEGSVLARAYDEVITPYRISLGSVIEPFRRPEQEQSDIPGVVNVRVDGTGPFSPFYRHGLAFRLLTFVYNLSLPPNNSGQTKIIQTDTQRIKEVPHSQSSR